MIHTSKCIDNDDESIVTIDDIDYIITYRNGKQHYTKYTYDTWHNDIHYICNSTNDIDSIFFEEFTQELKILYPSVEMSKSDMIQMCSLLWKSFTTQSK